MQKWFNFSLISSEMLILVSWQLRSQVCLTIREAKNAGRAQALISDLLFFPHACHCPYPQHAGYRPEAPHSGHKSKPGLSDGSTIQNIEPVCPLCTCWAPYQLCYCCLHSELWTQMLFLLLYWPHLQLWLYLLMPAVTHLRFTDHPKQAERYSWTLK